MIRAVAGTFISKFLGAILNFLVIILLSQNLGPEGKGLATLLLTTIAIVIIFSNLIGGAPLIYLSPRKSTKQLLFTSYSWAIFVSSITYFILLTVDLGINKNWFIPIALLSLIEGFSSANMAVLVGKEKIKQNNIVSILKSVILFGTIYYLLQIKSEKNIDSYIIALYIAYLSALILSSIFVSKVFDKGPTDSFKHIFKSLLKNGILNQSAYILSFLSFRISYYIINKYLGEGDLGIYSNAISIAESIWLISRSISLVQFSKIVNSNDLKTNQNLTINLFKITTLISIIALIPLLLLPDTFYSWLFGKGFEGVHEIILFISPGILAFNLYLIIGHYFSGTENFKILTITSCINFVLNIILTFIFVNYFGILGAAAASSITLIISTILIMIYYNKASKQAWKQYLFNRNDSSQLKALILQILKNK